MDLRCMTENCSLAMKTAIAIVLALSLMVGADARGAWAGDVSAPNSIKVVVVGLHNDDGEVDCALFGSADGFPSDSLKAAKTTKSKIENAQAICMFADVAPADYAVSVFHDEKGNGILDRNFLGIPKEGVGASNDAAGSLGPPKFDDARFSYKGGRSVLAIHVRYLLGGL
jgi:uncharacterized protein (DUF2141 family)